MRINIKAHTCEEIWRPDYTTSHTWTLGYNILLIGFMIVVIIVITV